VGQLIAQRPGTLPEEYIEAMFELANRVPPMGYGMVKDRFLAEFRRTPSEVFASFERQPIAAASFGQVHRARLADGREVAVKVQYPAVDQALQSDLRNVRVLLTPVSKILNLVDADEALREVESHVTAELDYTLEAQHQQRFAEAFAGDPYLRIPGTHPEVSTRRVLTSDFVDGVDLRAYLALHPNEPERQHFANAILRFGWISLFRHQMLHADPNPGNYLLAAGGRLGVVDFGCVKRFTPAFIADLKRLMIATHRRDRGGVDESMAAAGLLPPEASSEQRELAREVIHLWGRPFLTDHFDFGDRRYLDDLLRLQDVVKRVLGRGNAINVPHDWLFYGRHLVGTTYLLHRLGAHGNYAEAIAPYVRG
jgi:predicted unusual protein kinase regulating ubiquinone biosynthesis (AarF/ABC1/UbiB family)